RSGACIPSSQHPTSFQVLHLKLESKHSWVLHGPLEGGKSVRIKKSTTRLAGMVARVYAKRIGFTDGQSGISFDDLTAGIQPEQRIIRDLIEVLRMLAHV
ncbi:hypothetical protein, partial [Burkholderia ubonensis]|uniref:hypothetical protein n=1 Tax=Burkholderia ubonensis TaxID=101571 RepID=UPI001E3E7AB2